jgi:transposase
VADPGIFRNGREFSAYFGLVPKQNSSGGKSTLLGISKRGDSYIRKMLIHGARAQLSHLERQGRQDKVSLWALKLKEKRGYNKAVVALANKNARIIWAVMNGSEGYKMAV